MYSDKDVTELLKRYELDAADRITTVAVTTLVIGVGVGFLLAIIWRG
jgi:hypothetical protein